MVFRTSLPLGSGVLWDFKPAADGQMGRIINLYRDWQISGDTAWLQEALAAGQEGARVRLDAVGRRPRRRDGGRAAQHLRHRVLRPEQHDGRVLPRRPQGRRRRMADAVGDVVAAKTYLAMYEKGRRGLRRDALERRVLRPEIRPGHGEEVPVRRGLPLRPAPRPVAGHGRRASGRYLPAERIQSLAPVDLQVQLPDRFPELLQRPADLRPQRREGPAPLLLAARAAGRRCPSSTPTRSGRASSTRSPRTSSTKGSSRRG